MRFLDEVKITVIAGNGGDGCISFQKNNKKNILSKPDGSNGGDGGNVWLAVDNNINTLNFFYFNRVFKAGHGKCGCSFNCTGKRGKDIVIKVPKGTRIYCQRTNQLLGDMIHYNGKRLMVAKGGVHGLGNKNFKYSKYNKYNLSSVFYNKNRGMLGECKNLLLEQVLIADVGMFGLPNSGKSSFIRVVSKAKPKIADYPFTTLVPYLGVVNICGYDNRFVIADIPGIIKGASSGLGLGIRFLKHLERCRMLLHFVDIDPKDQSDPLENIVSIEQELNNYHVRLVNKPRWLIFNKTDLIDRYRLKNRISAIIQSLQWKGRFYSISVINKINIEALCYDIGKFINKNT